MRIKSLKQIIAVAIALIVAVVYGYLSKNKVIVLGKEYSELLNRATFIEVKKGSTGERLTFNEHNNIAAITAAMENVELTRDSDQNDRVGWSYRVKCSVDNEWMELTIGGSKLTDNLTSRSPYYEIEGEEALVKLLSSYFKVNKEISLIEELNKREINKVEVFSGLVGEKIIYDKQEDINNIIKLLEDERLQFVDYSNDGKVGSNISIKFYSDNDYIFIVYGGGSFQWLFETTNKPLTAYYKAVHEGINLLEVLEYTGLPNVWEN
ncbi:hypothetical protein [Clostridium thermarum]|uniref:hypothetical protein n=1 Tax=Clostridium thermarum TaxID=1716543 RepID=UPI0013D76DA4|nr:hypothetical protein [Clostridium thermarum]